MTVVTYLMFTLSSRILALFLQAFVNVSAREFYHLMNIHISDQVNWMRSGLIVLVLAGFIPVHTQVQAEMEQSRHTETCSTRKS
jgi:hypothetical protein